MTHDLFGEIPVPESEIVDWVEATAPRWLSPKRSFEGYVRAYDVPGKIRDAKASGIYNEIVSRRPPQWHARLALDAIV